MGLKLSDDGWWPKAPHDSTVGSHIPNREGLVIPCFGWLDTSDWPQQGGKLIGLRSPDRKAVQGLIWSSGSIVPSLVALEVFPLGGQSWLGRVDVDSGGGTLLFGS